MVCVHVPRWTCNLFRVYFLPSSCLHQLNPATPLGTKYVRWWMDKSCYMSSSLWTGSDFPVHYQPYNLYICSVHSMFFLQHRRLNNPAKMQLNDHVPQTHSCSCCVPFLTVATGFNWVPVRNINCSISHLSLGLAESEEVRVRRIFIPAQNRIEPTSRPFHLLW